ncbi:SusC/RagA family TonB-linked outer membrane protein [Fulvivirgaceae bacterium PWU5]|uniref:SusC/RagA family TonB-linked outer membrane protein n=1 Tax=Dawidia cretensis TaxID=2782350 RepID=A0AAP2DX84_9BACT|nr:SusC/RagA family TonB-linked outer membrane protein [Dawidia cretensis]MBT1707767.1 SusC/RagA family TonB-linked outer membrane protein [Dawidia cretensis]
MKSSLHYILSFMLAVLVPASLLATDAAAQSARVSGRVISQSDGNTEETLPGVSVSIKGTSLGTVTDTDGNYTIDVPSTDATLVFTFIGYTTEEIRVGEQTTINVTLTPDITTLEEVVVVGAVVRRQDLTGAVAHASEEQLRQQPVSTFSQAMQGRMAGVLVQNDPRPGSNGTTIQIRGNNSLQFGTNPIVVVDGLIMDGGLNLINPNDIATIDVLKDASATALYGSRASNGVVVITTKKGKKGEGRITYDGWVGVQDLTRLMPRLGTKDLFDLRVDAFANGYMDDNPGADRQQYINGQVLNENNSVAFADYEFDAHRNNQSYDWLDRVIRTGRQQNHTLGFSRGNDDGSIYVSFNYVDQKGVVQNAGYQRYTGRLNAEQYIKRWLKIGTNTSYSHSADQFVEGSVFSTANGANPMMAITDTAMYLKWSGLADKNIYNPLLSLRIKGDSYQTRLMSSNYVAINPLEGLNIRSTFSADVMDKRDYWYTPNNVGQAFRASTDEKATGVASLRNDHWLNWQWDNSIAYDKIINERHVISGLVTVSAQKNNWDYNQIDAQGFATNDFGYRYISEAFNRDDFKVASDFTTSTILSYLGRVNYTYNDRYFATVTIRRDGSSKFGEGNKWGTFPSVVLAWNIAKESFMEGANLDQLKLRAGYGRVGNQNIPNYAYLTLYRAQVSGDDVDYKPEGTLGNSSVGWESQKQVNVGVDVAVLNNRITFTADYFNTDNTNLLMRRTLPSTSGFTSTIANIGVLNNHGVELTVNANVINTQDLRWSVAANFTSTRNKIKALYGDVDAIYKRGGATGVEMQREENYFVGESVNSIYVYKFDKIAQESDMDRVAAMNLARKVRPGDILPLDRDNDGDIDDHDRFAVGRKDPKFYGGFSTDLTFRNFSLNAVFNYNYGSKRISGLYEGYMNGTGMYAAHEDMLNRWTPTNTNTNVPRAYNGSDRYGYGDVDLGVQNASFLRLSALTLAYNLPTSLVQKLKMNSFRFYVTGSNVFLVTKYKGYDPETGDDFPNSRMLVTGVNIGF